MKQYIYAIDENEVYEVVGESTNQCGEWHHGAQIGRNRSLSRPYDRAFIKRGAPHFRIIPENIAHLIAGKLRTDIIAFFIDQALWNDDSVRRKKKQHVSS